SMVALCVDAGRGTIDPGSISERLEARDRRVARGAAPARGLTLWKVEYGTAGGEAADRRYQVPGT
ncbi:MAG TPA: tRNA pseudouridine(38-40) synthase TruA, partial [Acidimicrobiia bacterium]|nr:tRNA pseudouridine(38-40) synthase TruA [Acidimicrobiia bacterium]